MDYDKLQIIPPKVDPDQLSTRELHDESLKHRESVREVFGLLKDKLDDKRQQVETAVDRTVEVRKKIDTFVHQHKWALVAGAGVLGFWLSKGRSRVYRAPTESDSGSRILRLVGGAVMTWGTRFLAERLLENAPQPKRLAAKNNQE